MKNTIKALALATLIAVPGLASATWVSHSEAPGVLMNEGGSHTVTHDLTSFGVPGGNQVIQAALQLSFSDDGDWFTLEWANITGEGISGFFEVDGSQYNYDVQWLNVGTAGLDSLNANGLLEVTITAAHTWFGHNDFWWEESTLYADIQSVPAPGALALLGLGLLSMGAVRRRRSA